MFDKLGLGSRVQFRAITNEKIFCGDLTILYEGYNRKRDFGDLRWFSGGPQP